MRVGSKISAVKPLTSSRPATFSKLLNPKKDPNYFELNSVAKQQEPVITTPRVTDAWKAFVQASKTEKGSLSCPVSKEVESVLNALAASNAHLILCY